MHPLGEAPQQHDGRKDVLGVVNRGLEPFLIAAGGDAQEHARGDARHDAEDDVEDIDALPVV